jgi:hypothetical protein
MLVAEWLVSGLLVWGWVFEPAMPSEARLLPVVTATLDSL